MNSELSASIGFFGILRWGSDANTVLAVEQDFTKTRKHSLTHPLCFQTNLFHVPLEKVKSLSLLQINVLMVKKINRKELLQNSTRY